MFDGLMVLKTFGDSKIDELNKLFTEYKYIELVNIIELNELYNVKAFTL